MGYCVLGGENEGYYVIIYCRIAEIYLNNVTLDGFCASIGTDETFEWRKVLTTSG